MPPNALDEDRRRWHRRQWKTAYRRQVTLAHEDGQISRQVHTAKAAVWVVGAGLASVVTIVGWIVTNAIAKLHAVLDAR